MIRTSLLVAVLASTIAATPPGTGGTGGTAGTMPTSPPAPAPLAPAPEASSQTVDTALLARAKSSFAQLQSGNIDRSTMSTDMNTALTDDKVAAVKSAIGSLGAPVSFVQQKTLSQGGSNYGVYLVTFANGTKFDFIFAVDGQGKVAGMRITPAQ